MRRIFVLRTLLLLFLASWQAIGVAWAKPNDPAPPPQYLSRLPVPEQVQVIENEYRQQSGGRSIPDGQLDFYLDKIHDSRWIFSQIQYDIAQSLRGNGYRWQPQASAAWRPLEVICTSTNSQYVECPTPFRGPARLIQQISFAHCLEGRNWGSRPGLVWVDEGCRGRFTEDRSAWPGWGAAGQRKVLCESRDNRYQQCNTDFRGPARLSHQLSQNSCIQGRSWGQMRGMVWVSRGCRAWFADTGGQR